jgi:hypothetical protein
VLEFLLSADFAGAADLRIQARSAMSVGGCACPCPSVDLVVTDPDAKPVTMPSRLVPAELQIQPNEDGIPGTVILFIDDGRLSYLEYVYYTDEVPTAWPSINQLSLHPRPL